VRRSLKAIEDYVKLGIVVEGATAQELAAKIGADPEKLGATIESYNAAVAAKKDAAFGRADLPRALAAAPYYAIEVLPPSTTPWAASRSILKAGSSPRPASRSRASSPRGR
jgi:fumarate reductase flavoprotein subunit